MGSIAKSRSLERESPGSRESRCTPITLLANRPVFSKAIVIAYDKTLRIENPRSLQVLIQCFRGAIVSRLSFLTL